MKKSHKVLWTIAVVILTAGVVVSGFEIFQWWNEGRKLDQETQDIVDDFWLPEELPTPSPESSEEEVAPEDTEAPPEPAGSPRPKAALDFSKLQAANAEAVGWIRIDGTKINHPVVQAQDNFKYLNLNVYGEYSSSGTPFLDCTNSLNPQDSNLVIYGHNMGTGRTSAFSTLLSYKHESQWAQHPLITLNLKGEESSWRIFAVMNFNMDDLGSYNYTTHNFLTGEEKVQFAEEAKQRSAYDTGVEVGEDDLILALSTCDRSSYGTQGRLVVMAVKE